MDDALDRAVNIIPQIQDARGVTPKPPTPQPMYSALTMKKIICRWRLQGFWGMEAESVRICIVMAFTTMVFGQGEGYQLLHSVTRCSIFIPKAPTLNSKGPPSLSNPFWNLLAICAEGS